MCPLHCAESLFFVKLVKPTVLYGMRPVSHTGHVVGSHSDLNPEMNPSHQVDFSGSTRLDIAISINIIVPIGNS